MGEHPSFLASAHGAATSLAHSGRCPRNSRTARSRNSGEYGFPLIFWSRVGDPRRGRPSGKAGAVYPVENVWQLPRDNLSNRVFKGCEDIVAHCCTAWNDLVDQP